MKKTVTNQTIHAICVVSAANLVLHAFVSEQTLHYTVYLYNPNRSIFSEVDDIKGSLIVAEQDKRLITKSPEATLSDVVGKFYMSVSSATDPESIDNYSQGITVDLIDHEVVLQFISDASFLSQNLLTFSDLIDTPKHHSPSEVNEWIRNQILTILPRQHYIDTSILSAPRTAPVCVDHKERPHLPLWLQTAVARRPTATTLPHRPIVTIRVERSRSIVA